MPGVQNRKRDKNPLPGFRKGWQGDEVPGVGDREYVLHHSALTRIYHALRRGVPAESFEMSVRVMDSILGVTGNGRSKYPHPPEADEPHRCPYTLEMFPEDGEDDDE